MWQIEYKGEKKTFEEWGVLNSSRRLLSLDIDVFQFEAARDIDEADLFERGQTIKVFNGEVQWFAGPIDQTPKTATGRYESHGYVAVGPWWYLANQVYQQTWKELANPLDSSAGFVTKYRSHLLLGYNVDGNFISTKDIVTDALNYVLGCAADAGIAAPFQIGTIDLPVLYPPVREVLNRACSEVILQVLRWTPDAIGIVDYATVPADFAHQTEERSRAGHLGHARWRQRPKAIEHSPALRPESARRGDQVRDREHCRWVGLSAVDR
jgi:hypothetical protein